jgi:hypothetical protein
MVKSAQMVIKDNDSVQMYFYADAEKKTEISKWIDRKRLKEIL